jgi:hypothetical protein
VVTEESGRTVALHPDAQIVSPMSAWVTDGLVAPGVRAEFGRTAPAALSAMPPARPAEAGRGLTGALEGAVVLGEPTALGPPVVALVEV